MIKRASRPSDGSAGFSLVEVIVVVAIIAIMAAVAVPAIARYVQNYRIRGALQGVSTEISTARGKAIMKNVNHGVAFVVLTSTTYRWFIEDNNDGTRDTMANLTGTVATWANQRGPLGELPRGITFSTTAGDCTGFTGDDSGFRLNRFGAFCDPGESGCGAALGVGLANSVMNDPATGATVCLVQDANNDGTFEFRRTVTVAPGGRVVTQQ